MTWIVFVLYVVVESVAGYRHELWWDELHHWDLARAPGTPIDLLRNIRYEGHPPLWDLLLWVPARFSHSLACVHIVQLLAAVGAAALLLFASPFRLSFRVLILSGYYFLFEYGVICRNYAVGVLLLFALCVVQGRGLRARPVLYYALLFALANVHFFWLAIGVGLHLAVLRGESRNRALGRRGVMLHAGIGAALVLIPLVFILPPNDSQLVPSFWFRIWTSNQLFLLLVAPLRAMIPLPAWWKYHFWNTQAMLELGNHHPSINVAAGFMSVLLVGAMFLAVRRDSKARLFLAVSFTLCLAAGVLFPLSSTRYAGVLFIAFLAACWIAGSLPRSRIATGCMTLLLAVQTVAGVFALDRDLRFPFSRSPTIAALEADLPQDGQIVADYSCVESLSAYLDRPFYSLQQGKAVLFTIFDRSFDPHRPYAEGLEIFFARSRAHEAFLFSPRSPDDDRTFDVPFRARFRADLLAKRDGAIEPGGDIYVYRVSRRPLAND